MKAGGGSLIWDAIKFSLDLLENNGEKERRKAIVLMSDGEDNSLMYLSGVGSKISFADLVDVVRRGSTAIFPIFLETQKKGAVGRAYLDARKTLEYLAEQSAGNMYQAKEIDDLNTVYGRVLTDVGTVYSIGFEPEEDTAANDNWRKLRVEVPSRPNLKLKYRPGYFVRP
jgi:VWFA-related protein